MYDRRSYGVESGESKLAFIKNLYNDMVSLSQGSNTIPNIILSGGDPLLHPDFWKILNYINTDRNTDEFIMGNPDEITKNVAKRLLKKGVHYYQMSLEGPPEVSDRLRGKKWNFKRTIEAAKILRSAGIKITIMFTLSMANKDHLLPLMDELAFAPIDMFSFARASSYGNAHTNDLDLTSLRPMEYRKVLINYLQKANQLKKAGYKVKWDKKCHLFALLYQELGLKLPSTFRTCLLRRAQSMAMLPDGTMLACRRMHYPLGKYPKTNLKEAFSRLADLALIIPKKCAKCSLVDKCLGCRAVGYELTNSLGERDIHCWKK